VNADAIIITLKLALLSSGILFALGLPLAYWLATTRWRFSFIISALVSLPIVLPPTVVGFYLLLVLGPHSPLGQSFAAVFGYRLPFSFTGMLVGAVIFNMPFALTPFISSFAAVDRKLVEVSWCLGVSKMSTFFKIILPMAWPGILTGLILSFAHALGEFGVVLMIGGNIPGVTQTVSTLIYDDVQAMNYSGANATAFALLSVSFITLCSVYALRRKAVSPC